MSPHARRRALTLGLLVAAPVSLWIALTIGSVHVPIGGLVYALTDSHRGDSVATILDLRLARALAAFVVGGLLALSGTLLQALVRNPLADPYVLGVSGGAAVAALGAMLLGAAAPGVSTAAFSGAILSTLLVFGLARSDATDRLLLTGAVVAALWGALIAGLLSIAPPSGLPGMLFWLMGDLGYARGSAWAWLILVGGLGLALAWGRALDALAHGDIVAHTVGVNVRMARTTLYFVASGLTATAVMIAGPIGFVGLMVPHVLRLSVGTAHRPLAVQAVLAGGSLLVLADTAARTVFAPAQLPVGVLTALIGVPTFLLLRARRSLDARH